MTFDNFIVLLYILRYSSLLVALVGILKWRKIENYLKVLTVLKIVSFLCDEAINFVYPNHAGSLYQILELLLVGYMYYTFFNQSKLRYPFMAIGLVLTIFGVINWIFIQGSEINSYTMGIDTIAMIALCIIYFVRMLTDLPTDKVSNKPMFWVNTGLMIYLCGALMLFIITDYMIHVVKDDLIVYWSFHNVLAIISNIFFFVGIWLGAKVGKIKQESI